MKKTLVYLILFVFGVSLVFATPYFDSGPTTNPISSCDNELVRDKTFDATASSIRIGLVCSDSAHIELYECENDDCTQKTLAVEGNKINNILPLFKGFTVGDYYQYKCFACKDDLSKCPITVTEGDLINIEWVGSDPDEDIGPQGKLTYEFEGKIGKDGRWQTKKGDAGVYNMKGKVYDGEFWDKTEFCVRVLKSNTAAVLDVPESITENEGDTVNIKTKCTDPDNDKVTLTYSGWMTSATKKTGFDDAGDYKVTVKCVDPDGEGETKIVNVKILNKNRPPKIIWK